MVNVQLQKPKVPCILPELNNSPFFAEAEYQDPSQTADMVEFLCSPHRIGRYRDRSSEKDMEYLLWLLNRR